ncbi:cyclic lactone autoinducer peptide [Rossellomorea arthrocnemi]|jgi:cyclic lactone autoinducer peptide|nr:cyclic lactone autoinducer peptide [Rossellomorea arthrocnemi]
MKFITYLIATAALFFNSATSLSSCFWFAYEPELPEKQSKE